MQRRPASSLVFVKRVFSSSEAGTEQRRKALGDNYDNKGDDEQKRDELILEQTHRGEQFEADAPPAPTKPSTSDERMFSSSR